MKNPMSNGREPMEDTGRVRRSLTASARRILFDTTTEAGIDAELNISSQIDQAHLIMLSEQGIISTSNACAILKAIAELRASNFDALRGLAAPRGLYLLYENYLIEKLGAEIGGELQTGRSRNDLNATIFRMRLREPYLLLIKETLRLQVVLIRRARKFADVVMPAYTHYQAAVPVTYGHYLAGIAVALERDLDGVFAINADLNRSPLGAGAAGGTSLAINPARTASLLGFEEPVSHSIDAVASRDIALRLLASISILGITLSRLANDLLVWTTSEFGLISLPDHLVGSSSMMPQKRNPFLAEHVKGRSSAALGAFVAAATAMHSTPFSNSIAVGTEATAHIWKALTATTEAVTLSRLLVDDARPQQDLMFQRTIEGHTFATELANRLVVDHGVPFRSAHRIVGRAVRESIEQAAPLHAISVVLPDSNNTSVSLGDLDPRSIVRKSTYGGGPGHESFQNCIKALVEGWDKYVRLQREQSRKWHTVENRLSEVALGLCKTTKHFLQGESV
jgi:argininosuccinate lyase